MTERQRARLRKLFESRDDFLIGRRFLKPYLLVAVVFGAASFIDRLLRGM